LGIPTRIINDDKGMGHLKVVNAGKYLSHFSSCVDKFLQQVCPNILMLSLSIMKGEVMADVWMDNFHNFRIAEIWRKSVKISSFMAQVLDFFFYIMIKISIEDTV